MAQENKINIAELLKDCPQGMELDCTMYDNLYFNQAYDDSDCLYKIGCYTIVDEIRTTVNFTEFGTFTTHANSKCVIFPKGKTTWEGFQRPFKDGDVIYNRLQKKICICYLCRDGVHRIKGCRYNESNMQLQFEKLEYSIPIAIQDYRLATEEEKEKLFDAIKANGYKWNEETKTLEKLVEPKFKVGDRVKRKEVNYTHIVTIVEIDGEYYTYVNQNGEPASISIKNQDNWELVPNKFDITTLKPFDKVLVRNTNKDYWRINMFGYISKGDKQYFMCTANSGFYQCIPYEGNEHLLGTSNNCDKYYKNW